MRPFACWVCGFESRRRHGKLSLTSVVCCQVEVCASGRSLVQRSPTGCGVSECDSEDSTVRRPCPARGFRTMVEKKKNIYIYMLFYHIYVYKTVIAPMYATCFILGGTLPVPKYVA
jgi:hypothetical protein